MPKNASSSSKGRDKMSSSRSSLSSGSRGTLCAAPQLWHFGKSHLNVSPSDPAPPASKPLRSGSWISSFSDAGSTASTRGSSQASRHTSSVHYHDPQPSDASSSSSRRTPSWGEQWEHVWRYLGQLGQIDQLTLGPRIYLGGENPDLPRLRTAADSAGKGSTSAPDTHYTSNVHWARGFFMDEDGPRPKTVVCSV